MQEQFRTVLGWFATNGIWTLVVLLFLAGIGIPCPASIALLVAGALVRADRMDLASVILAGTISSTLAHVASYWMGRRGLRGAFKKLQERRAWRKAHSRYEARRDATIFLSRWLLTPLALPVNLIAGAEKYSLFRFVVGCAIGNALWVFLYGGVGYAVGAASGRLGEAARWLGYTAGAAMISIAAWFIARRFTRHAAPNAI